MESDEGTFFLSQDSATCLTAMRERTSKFSRLNISVVEPGSAFLTDLDYFQFVFASWVYSLQFF